MAMVTKFVKLSDEFDNDLEPTVCSVQICTTQNQDYIAGLALSGT